MRSFNDFKFHFCNLRDLHQEDDSQTLVEPDLLSKGATIRIVCVCVCVCGGGGGGRGFWK